jgi:hypothetical protein
MSIPIGQFDHQRECILEPEASNFGSVVGLYQPDDEGLLDCGANLANKQTPVECNYDIYIKQLMAIINSLEKWRHE